METLLKHGLETKNDKGQTALLLACENGSFEKARELIGKGANVNVRDNNGRTPIMIACEKGQTDLLIFLLSNGAEASVLVNSTLLTREFLKEHPELAGCMFALGDQPLLTQETLEAMGIAFSQCDQNTSPASSSAIFRLASVSGDDLLIPGNPVLFGSRYFEELLTLPDNQGGNVLLKKYPDNVRYFPVSDPLELADADTPADLEQLKKAEFIR